MQQLSYKSFLKFHWIAEMLTNWIQRTEYFRSVKRIQFSVQKRVKSAQEWQTALLGEIIEEERQEKNKTAAWRQEDNSRLYLEWYKIWSTILKTLIIGTWKRESNTDLGMVGSRTHKSKSRFILMPSNDSCLSSI